MVVRTQETDPAVDLAAVWKDYRETSSTILRDELIKHYLFLTKRIANKISARLPRSVDVQDLRSFGVLGLLRAIENFDLSRGMPFESYAATRIHGAILDGLRATDWVPRLVREKADLYRSALAELQTLLGREPSVPELAEHLQLSVAATETLHSEATLVYVYTLCREDMDGNEDPRVLRSLDVLIDHNSGRPMEELETRDLLARILRQLTAQEQRILNLYYTESLTMKEIGQALGVSESRICQIHAKAIKRLKAEFVVNRNEKRKAPHFVRGKLKAFVLKHYAAVAGQNRSQKAKALCALAQSQNYEVSFGSVYSSILKYIAE